MLKNLYKPILKVWNISPTKIFYPKITFWENSFQEIQGKYKMLSDGLN